MTVLHFCFEKYIVDFNDLMIQVYNRILQEVCLQTDLKHLQVYLYFWQTNLRS